jgi:hypothetical protein
MNFGLIFCTVVDPIIVHIKIFCLEFFKTLKYHFRFFLENGLHGARAPLEVFAGFMSFFTLHHNEYQVKKSQIHVNFFPINRKLQNWYSLRPLLLFINIYSTKMCLETFIFAKDNMGRKEYLI